MTTPATPQRAPLHLPFVLVAVLAAIGLGLTTVMYVLGSAEHVPSFTGFFLTVFVGLTGFATAVYQLGKTERQLDEIRTNTNGTLSAEKQRSAILEAQVLQLGGTPATAGASHTTSLPTTPA
jgi:hypothetical protein